MTGKILDEILTDDNLAWDRNLEKNKQKFLVDLNSEIIEELVKRNKFDFSGLKKCPFKILMTALIITIAYRSRLELIK